MAGEFDGKVGRGPEDIRKGKRNCLRRSPCKRVASGDLDQVDGRGGIRRGP